MQVFLGFLLSAVAVLYIRFEVVHSAGRGGGRRAGAPRRIPIKDAAHPVPIREDADRQHPPIEGAGKKRKVAETRGPYQSKYDINTERPTKVEIQAPGHGKEFAYAINAYVIIARAEDLVPGYQLKYYRYQEKDGVRYSFEKKTVTSKDIERPHESIDGKTIVLELKNPIIMSDPTDQAFEKSRIDKNIVPFAKDIANDVVAKKKQEAKPRGRPRKDPAPPGKDEESPSKAEGSDLI